MKKYNTNTIDEMRDCNEKHIGKLAEIRVRVREIL